MRGPDNVYINQRFRKNFDDLVRGVNRALENSKALTNMGFLLRRQPSKRNPRQKQRFFLTVFLTAIRRCWIDAGFLPPSACAEAGRLLSLVGAAKTLSKPDNA